MEKFPWWTDGQKSLADEVEAFVDEALPRSVEVAWKKEYPRDFVEAMAKRGWFGAMIPEEYRGLGLNVTGACIVGEELARAGAAFFMPFTTTMIGGTEQILKFGTPQQKKHWLPKIAEGKTIGAVVITEPPIGSDAAAMQTTARKEGDGYLLDGKKRFITNAGIADFYVVYALTSEKPEDRAKYRHLSAFIVEKGWKGFSVEKINELCGWDGVRNGYLDFDGVHIPPENRLLGEGEGWRVLTSGLNFERTIIAAATLGEMREALRYAVFHTQRRVQFGSPTIEFQNNQFKIADIILRLYASRILTYYTAHLLDKDIEAPLESSVAKLYSSEAEMEAAQDALQCMGGDGWTKFYPVERIMRDARINQIGAGTSEVMRMIIFRQGLKVLAGDLKSPRLTLHPELGLPIPIPPSKRGARKRAAIRAEEVLEILAEDYRVNPGLYMSLEDLKEATGADGKALEERLLDLEKKGQALLHRGRGGAIALAKASYKGLRKAKPKTYYRWFPSWVKEGDIF